MLYTSNTALQTIPVDTALNLGDTIVRDCCCIKHDSGSTAVVMCCPGTYIIHVNATAVATAAGPVTISLRLNGVNYTGATATETIAAAGDSANLSFTAAVRVAPNCPAVCNNPISATVVSTGTATTYSNVAVTVTK